MDLLSEGGFEIERLEHKHSEMVVPAASGHMAWWNFVAASNDDGASPSLPRIPMTKCLDAAAPLPGTPPKATRCMY